MIHHPRCDTLKCEGDCATVLSRRSFLVGLGATVGVLVAGPLAKMGQEPSEWVWQSYLDVPRPAGLVGAIRPLPPFGEVIAKVNERLQIMR